MTTIRELSNMTGRCALVTGATGHLGRVICETMAELGAQLILLDRQGSPLDHLQASLLERWGTHAFCVACDLEDGEQRSIAIQQVKSRTKSLNCLINNAAFVGASNLTGWLEPFPEQSIDTWRRALEVNLTAPFHLAQEFAPELRSSDGGTVVNISSIYGANGVDWNLYKNTEMGNPAAYAVSKGGLNQLTRWLATALAPEVRVNAIAPGGIYRCQPAEFVKRYEKRTPLARMALEEDFRGALAFLATDLSRYVTGQVLTVDGGFSIV